MSSNLYRSENTCNGRLLADAKSKRPLWFGPMSLSEMGAVYTQKTKTDCEVSLTLTEQHTGLELDEPQAPGQVQGQSDTIQFQV